MTELLHNGKTVVAAIHLSKTVRHHMVNDIACVYAKDYDRWFQELVRAGSLRYINKHKSREWFQIRGLYLPKMGTLHSSTKKILTENDVVKPDSVSRVVDANGEPLVVYHGTNKRFSIFKGKKRGVIFFHRDPDLAEQYAEKGQSLNGGAGGSLIPVYLKAERIWDYENPKHLSLALDEPKSIKGFHPWMEKDLREGDWEQVEKKAVLEVINAAGFDSIYVNDHPGKAIGVFEPTQIKSVFNTGAFDESNPDIQYSIASTATAKLKTSSTVQALAQHLRERNETGFLGRIFRTAEYWNHPVGKEIFEATQDREDTKHQIFNQVLKATTVVDALTKFRNAGANVLRKLTGYDLYDLSKAPKMYREIHDILIHMDDHNRRWEDSTDASGQVTKGYRTVLLEKNDAPKEVIETIDGIRKMLDEALELQRAPIKKLIEAYQRAGKAIPVVYHEKDADGNEKPVTLKDLYNRMGDLSGSYFPRRREAGDWGVRSKKIQRNAAGEVIRDENGKAKTTDYYYQQPSLRAAYEFRKLVRKEGHTDIGNPFRVEKMPETIYEDLKIPDLQAALDRIVAGADLDPDTKAKMRSDLLQEAANLLKERGFRTSKIRRAGGDVVKGYIEDPLMAIATYAHSVAGGIAKSEAATKMFNALSGQWYKREEDEWVLRDDDGEVLKSIPLTDKEKESEKRSKKIGGIRPEKDRKRYDTYTEYIAEQLRNPDATDRAIALGKSIVSFKYLGLSPRTVLVNMTSLMTTAPAALHEYAMGGKGRMTKVGSEIMAAVRDYTKVMTGKRLALPFTPK